MRKKEETIGQQQVIIDETATIRGMFGRQEERGIRWESLATNPAFGEFRRKIKSIQNAAYHRRVDFGVILVLINKTFGYHDWDIIPFGKIDEIRNWVINNWFREIQILYPERHAQLMAVEDKRYSEEFLQLEKPAQNNHYPEY
jgi:hypothetical protein